MCALKNIRPDEDLLVFDRSVETIILLVFCPKERRRRNSRSTFDLSVRKHRCARARRTICVGTEIDVSKYTYVCVCAVRKRNSLIGGTLFLCYGSEYGWRGCPTWQRSWCTGGTSTASLHCESADALSGPLLLENL